MRVWLFAWSFAAFALACSRVPYDDEWFSIEIALERTPAQFWYAVEGEPHPVWIAGLDRALGSLVHAPLALQALRIVATAAALAVLAAGLRRRLELPRWAFGLAALHPIVIFYAGAARWYPYLLLAHALRVYALWSDRDAQRRPAFIAGAWVGAATSYIDALFLAHDTLYFALRARQRAGVAAVAAWLSVPVSLLVSPLHAHGTSAFQSIRYAHWDIASTARWVALGLAGEGGLPWPAPLLGVACFVTAAWAVVRALRTPAQRDIATYVSSYGCVWVVAYGFGVAHPRYSLLLWLLIALLALAQLRQAGRAMRLVAALAAVHLILATGLTFTGTGFYKGDLNAPTQADCAQLRAADASRALIVPYAGLASFASGKCGVQTDVVRVPSALATRSEGEQLAGLPAVFAHPGRYSLATLNTVSSLSLTQQRVRAFIDARCAAIEERDFGALPHPEVRRDRAADYRRYTLTTFECLRGNMER